MRTSECAHNYSASVIYSCIFTLALFKRFIGTNSYMEPLYSLDKETEILLSDKGAGSSVVKMLSH